MIHSARARFGTQLNHATVAYASFTGTFHASSGSNHARIVTAVNATAKLRVIHSPCVVKSRSTARRAANVLAANQAASPTRVPTRAAKPPLVSKRTSRAPLTAAVHAAIV